ncbi:hypothetical protein [Virgibacillus ndiopensis]|uniref:hypothetical protein n=1 Tax=Virgibacillus ndiopensis TaxID=2004408 RepID=UPI000C0733A2|nr:hypothetical protein [Virgibacillus ndiopensis]
MKLISTSNAPKKQVEQFLTNNQDVNKKALMQNGYVVEVKEKIEGCFILEQEAEGVYWLKQLHVTKQAAPALPILLEAILALAKEHNARSVYVHSHQPMVDVLLEALQFHPQNQSAFVDKHPREHGNWWTYNVS